MAFDVVDYLMSKDVHLKPAGSGESKTHCFFHEEEHNKPGRLYIHTGEDEQYGTYFCFVCNAKGNFNTIRKHFGDSPIQTNELGGYNKILELATDYYHSVLMAANPDVEKDYAPYLYLTDDRGLTEEAIIQFRLGYADGNLKTHLFKQGCSPEEIESSGLMRKDGSDYWAKGTIVFPYMVRGCVSQLRGKQIGGPTKSMMGVQSQLYCADTIIGEDTIYIAEGEIDCLSLQQLGFPTVGVPGVQTWKEEWTTLVGEAKRIFIIYDTDNPGRAGAEKAAKDIGPRSRVVALPEEGIDINDFFVKLGRNREDFEYLLAKAKGGILVSPLQAMEEWMNIEGSSDGGGLQFGIDGLDRAVPSGILPGQVVVLPARTNNSKTVFTINLMEYMRRVKTDIQILYISLEQTRNEWFHRAHLQNNFYNPGATPLDTAHLWMNNLILTDKNRLSHAQLVECIDQSHYESGRDMDLIIVDYLGYYARSYSGEAKERTTEAIMGLKEIGKEFSVPIFTPHQANRTGKLGEAVALDAMKDSSSVEETADLVISQWRPYQGTLTEGHDSQGQVHRGEIHQQIMKSRGGVVGDVISYIQTPLTVAMVPMSDPMYNRALREWGYYDAGDTWQQAIERHLNGTLAL